MARNLIAALPGAATALTVMLSLAALVPAPAAAAPVETWVSVLMPPGFHVESTDVDGPVFADANGKTLYAWPLKRMRNGYAGESKGKPGCYGKARTETAGLMSPYPPGIVLPELDKRPACTDLWEPVRAAADAKPVGKWTVLDRTDGIRQWAFDEHPLYTSRKDLAAGDVNGSAPRGGGREEGLPAGAGGGGGGGGGDSPAYRIPAGPPALVPPGLKVRTSTMGRMLVTNTGFAVYAFSKDTATKSACDAECARDWPPVLAPQLAKAGGEWSILERASGERQWMFRNQPLYSHTNDTRPGSQEGGDVPGWHNVYAQQAPPPPPGFTVQDTIAGAVLADARGMTVYVYNCGDDSEDQLSCDHPDDTQVYRLAICGGGDAAKCRQYWPYVPAARDAKSGSRIWSVMLIDPATGHRARRDQADAMAVWAYRDRPIYTFSGDAHPGDVNGDGTGEWRGQRNGLKALWLREEMLGG
jgi:predicted lipoprotein with Yx(FWY)xxD motif